MTNLVERYGVRWFRNKFGGSYFMHRGIPAVVQQVEETSVGVSLYPRVDNVVKVVNTKLPTSVFRDHKMFYVPELGYRHSQDGKWLGYISRTNTSYNRGIGINNISVAESRLTRSLRGMGVSIKSLNGGELCNAVLDPGFIPFHRGIKLMLEGKIVSFAASPTIAVVPTPEQDSLTIMVCSREVGTVSPDGEINMVLPFAKSYLEETTCRQ
jgi:hypothetical protein